MYQPGVKERNPWQHPPPPPATPINVTPNAGHQTSEIRLFNREQNKISK